MVEQVKQFTKKEIVLNNGLNDSRLWMVLDKNVYDLTNFMDEHPGGADLLLEYAGKDGTNVFYDFGHSSYARRVLTQYKIGILKEEIITEDLNNEHQQNKNSFKRLFFRVIFGRCRS